MDRQTNLLVRNPRSLPNEYYLLLKFKAAQKQVSKMAGLQDILKHIHLFKIESKTVVGSFLKIVELRLSKIGLRKLNAQNDYVYGCNRML